MLAIRSSGAYGFAYGIRTIIRVRRAAEVIVDGEQHYCVRERERFDRTDSRRVAATMSRIELRFAKMHGLGNDFIVIDAINQDFETTSPSC